MKKAQPVPSVKFKPKNDNDMSDDMIMRISCKKQTYKKAQANIKKG